MFDTTLWRTKQYGKWKRSCPTRFDHLRIGACRSFSGNLCRQGTPESLNYHGDVLAWSGCDDRYDWKLSRVPRRCGRLGIRDAFPNSGWAFWRWDHHGSCNFSWFKSETDQNWILWQRISMWKSDHHHRRGPEEIGYSWWERIHR